MPQAQSQQMSRAQQNALARQLIQSQAIEMTQQIYTNTVNPINTPVLNITPRNVGLIKGFFVEVTATVNNNDNAAAVTPSDFNAANIFSQISFTDLNNNSRINTTGWHLALINSLKARRPYGAAFTNAAQDMPVLYGANWTIYQATASIAHNATGTVKFVYWIPLAYSDHDYRGALYANVVNAVMNLQLTFNANVSAASGGDSTATIYTGSASVTLNPATVTVYQVYMDQIPVGQGGIPVLPMLDMSTIYELKNTTFTGLVSGQDFPMQYANYRDFMSTICVFNDGSATNGGRRSGPDVNYWALQSANFTNIFKRDPQLQSLLTRNILGSDVPPGTYYFSHRAKPIATIQYGNMQLVLNPAGTLGADHTSYVLAAYEDMALVTTLSQAGSLAGN